MEQAGVPVSAGRRVEQQFLITAGPDISSGPAAVRPAGHALELPIYAEDPKRFLPSRGLITEWAEPSGPGIRVDAGYGAGHQVTPFYDPLLAKLCVHGGRREQALDRTRGAVVSFRIAGPQTNLALSRRTARQRRVRQRAVRYAGGRPAAMMSMMMAQPWHRSPGHDARRCA